MQLAHDKYLAPLSSSMFQAAILVITAKLARFKIVQLYFKSIKWLDKNGPSANGLSTERQYVENYKNSTVVLIPLIQLLLTVKFKLTNSPENEKI